MVISHIIGGLGNQMFQYAVGRAHSLKFNTSVTLDISGFDNYLLHQGFELQKIFQGSINIAIERDMRNILGWQAAGVFRRYLQSPSMALFRWKSFIVEPYFHYWSGIKCAPRNSYLVGYWQSEKYFSKYSNEIREDFSFNELSSDCNKGIALEISQTNAVSLHIRRGDYVSDAKTVNMLGVCSLQYYQRAISYISKQVENPHFFIFSDDIAWAKENIKLDFPCLFVGHNKGEHSYIDMQLMSLCNHHIIANSSFSWWAAWLNKSDSKIVVAPKRWFRDDFMESQGGDIVPESWVRL